MFNILHLLHTTAMAGPFSRKFPDATCWIQPGQWSFPFNLPTTLYGFPTSGNKLKFIPSSAKEAPWYEELDHYILGPLRFKSVGGFSETAFFHRKTGTLLVTDTIVKVGDNPPPILQEDPRAILYHSRDSIFDNVEDNIITRRRGYRRMTLFGLIFYPGSIRVNGIIEAFTNIKNVPENIQRLGRGALPFSDALYPWQWIESEEKSFKALQGGLLVAPILQKLILDREPEIVLNWVENVSKWSIKRIIPSHLDNDIKASSQDFKNAFSFLKNSNSNNRPIPTDKDLFILNTVSDLFTKLGIVGESKVNITKKV